MSPVTLLFGPVAAWNALQIIAVSSSAFTAYLALGRFSRSWLARMLGGATYGFSSYMVNQSLGHAHLTLAWYPPVLLVLIDVLFIRPRTTNRWRIGALLGIATAAQLLTGEELLATSAISAVVLLGVAAGLNRNRIVSATQGALPALGIATIVFAVLAAYPLGVQFLGQQRVTGLLQPTNVYVTDAANFAVPTAMQAFGTPGSRELAAHFAGGSTAEADSYIGIPLLAVLAVIAVVLRRRRAVLVAMLTSCCLGFLSLGPRLHAGGHITRLPLPWALVDRIPVLQNILPVRLMAFVFLGAAVVVAIGVDAALQARRSWKRFALTGAVAASLVPLLPVHPFPARAPNCRLISAGPVRHPSSPLVLFY